MNAPLPVLVITGAGGIGAAVARRCGAGHSVVLGDRDTGAREQLAAALRADGIHVVSQAVDVSDRASVHELAVLAAATGPVTRVVHTAGISQGPVERILAVDIAGTAIMLDEFGAVVEAGGAGVLIASMAGSLAPLPADVEQALATLPAEELLAVPFLAGVTSEPAAYAVSKRANQVRMVAAAPRWGDRGARLNSVSPGIISTPMSEQELTGPHGHFMTAMLAAAAAGRIGTPQDVAAAIEFLLDVRSSFITGADLLVDGGVVAAMRAGRVVLPTLGGG